MPILSGGPLYRDKTKPIEDYTASTGEVFGAAAARAFDTGLSDLAVGAAQLATLDVSGGLQNIGRVFGVDAAAEFDPSNRVSAADARKAAEKRGVKLDIADDAYFSPGELDTVLRLKERERKQQAVLARRPKTWGGFATEMAGGLAGSLADPVQVAASFIPVVPAAKYAMWLERAGSAGGRAAVRAGVGAAEGLVGSAVIEPFAYTRAQKIGLDYTAQDSFLNLAFGTVLGGGLHVAVGALGDVLSPARRAASVAPEMQSRAALHEAVTALDAGRPLDIQPVFENKSGVRPEGGTPASRANPDEPAPFSGERGQNAPSAPKVNAGDTASVVEATLRDLGIPYQVERSQFQSDKFGPSLSTYFRTDKGTFRLSDHLDVTGRDTFLIGDDPAKIRVEMFKAAGVEPTRYDTERLAALREIEAKQREWLRNEPSRKTAALSEWDAAALKDAGLSDLKGPEKTKALKKLRDAARASGEYPPKLPQMPDFGSLPPYRYPDPSAGVREPSIAPETYDPVTGYEPPEMERVRVEADAALTRADDDIDGEIEALNEMLVMAEKREPLNEFDRAALDLADAFETKSRISADSYRAAASCLSGLA